MPSNSADRMRLPHVDVGAYVMTGLQATISIMAGIVTVIGGFIRFIKWSDSASPHSNARAGDSIDWSFMWIPILFSLGGGAIAFLLLNGILGVVAFPLVIGIIVALALWFYW